MKVAIDAWTTPAGIEEGHAFRPVSAATASRASVRRLYGRCSVSTRRKLAFPQSHHMTCAEPARSCAARQAASWSRSRCCSANGLVQTIGRYLGTKQDLVHAPNDAIGLRVTA